MIPETLDFMIAGYAVIVIGIAGYIISLIARAAKVKRGSASSHTNPGAEDID